MYSSIHLNLFRFIIANLIIGLFLMTFGCKFLPTLDCEVSEADAKIILGSPVVFPFNRYDSRLQIPDDRRNSPYLKACGYATEKNKDFPFLHWYNTEFDNVQKAQEFFNGNFRENPPKRASDHLNFSYDAVSGIGDEGFLEKEEFEGNQNTNLSDNSVDEIKTLARKIADKISD
jgi:hypothetical protein